MQDPHKVNSDGLFNTRLNESAAMSAASSAEMLPIENQGLSVFVTSLPSNLYSGTQAQDDEHEVHYGRGIQHLLNPSHPGQIDETVNWWDTPLRTLIQDPQCLDLGSNYTIWASPSTLSLGTFPFIGMVN